MRRFTVGQRIYFSVISIFLLYSAAFIIFQQRREKEYKINVLDIRLQDYNLRMNESLSLRGDWSEQAIDKYVRTHDMPNLRVTIVRRNGKVVFDNVQKDYAHMQNHSDREEIKEALSHGHGTDINRYSATLNKDYFYSATYFPRQGIIIRSTLPYNNDLSKSLRADQHYIWFAITAMIVLTLVLYRFIHRLGANITKLRLFASRADHNESLETEDLVEFPADELGEIAERIIKMYKRLQTTRKEQDVLKRQLTQNIAHELKTPVASIQGYLETILSNKHINEAMKQQFLERCFAQTQRLTSLLQDISTLNRMDDAPGFATFDDVDLSQTVSNIANETSLQFEKHDMTLVNKLPQGIVVHGNSSLLYSVFRNLTDNAIAYAGAGTTVTISASDEGDRWHFTFSDNGTGVPAEHLPRLFERFYRVDKGRSRKMGGTGLGLAIVKNAVLLHGGSISVHNNPTGGLRFDFTLKNK